MGKKGKWLSAVKKAFSPSKDADKSTPKNKEDTENQEQKKALKEKKRWNFGRSTHHDAALHEAPSYKDSARSTRLTSLPEQSSAQVEEQQSKRALAVAAATAAAAEAAVAAAQAAAEVVRLTGSGCVSFCGGWSREEVAAIKIQAAFRGYLARRAFRALRGLVRLQALVRGHAVRRQATATLRCMQALVRVQVRVRARRVHISEEGQAVQNQLLQKQHEDAVPKPVSESGCEGDWDGSVQPSVVIQAKMQSKQEASMKRDRALAYAISHQMWRSAQKSDSSMAIDNWPDKPQCSWSWLERWMASRPWESRAPDKENSEGVPLNTIEENRQNTNLRNARSQIPAYSSLAVTGSKITRLAATHSPVTPQSFKPVTSNVRYASPSVIQRLEEDGSAISTARSTPSLVSAPPRYSSRLSIASSSVCDDESLASFSAVPSYMAATESARAKFRSHSTPKQRPRTPDDSLLSAKKRLSFPVEPVLDISGSLKATKPTFPQRSPSLKIRSGSLKSEHSLQGTAASLNGDFRRHYK